MGLDKIDSRAKTAFFAVFSISILLVMLTLLYFIALLAMSLKMNPEKTQINAYSDIYNFATYFQFSLKPKKLAYKVWLSSILDIGALFLIIIMSGMSIVIATKMEFGSRTMQQPSMAMPGIRQAKTSTLSLYVFALGILFFHFILLFYTIGKYKTLHRTTNTLHLKTGDLDATFREMVSIDDKQTGLENAYRVLNDAFVARENSSAKNISIQDLRIIFIDGLAKLPNSQIATDEISRLDTIDQFIKYLTMCNMLWNLNDLPIELRYNALYNALKYPFTIKDNLTNAPFKNLDIESLVKDSIHSTMEESIYNKIKEGVNLNMQIIPSMKPAISDYVSVKETLQKFTTVQVILRAILLFMIISMFSALLVILKKP